MTTFTNAFFDELEKLGARKARARKPKRLRVKTLKIPMPVVEESKSPNVPWGKRIGLIVGRLFKNRELARQRTRPLRIPRMAL